MRLLLLLAWMSSTDAGIPPELSALVRHLASTEEISARFTQRQTLAALKDALVSEGSFSWKRGGKLVWKTEKPSPSEIDLDDKGAVIKYPALRVEQTLDAQSQPQLASVFQSILAVFRGDLDRLRPQFTLAVTGASPLSLELTPRSEAINKVIRRIRLRFDAKLNLSQVVLDEAGGDQTDIAFRDHVVREAR